MWDITVPSGGNHIPRKPVYTLHTSFPVRRVAWRPNYECELAVTSYLEGSANSQPNPALDLSTAGPPASPRISNLVPPEVVQSEQNRALYSRLGDPVEVWDVRRGYIAKWSVPGSAVEGGVTGWTFTYFMDLLLKRLHIRYRIRGFAYYVGSAFLWNVLTARSPKGFQTYRGYPTDFYVLGRTGLLVVRCRSSEALGGTL